MKLVSCPECGAPAEVLDEFTLSSTDGPIPHAKVQCLHGHGFTMPTDRLQGRE